jgi:hypothetical protein
MTFFPVSVKQLLAATSDHAGYLLVIQFVYSCIRKYCNVVRHWLRCQSQWCQRNNKCYSCNDSSNRVWQGNYRRIVQQGFFSGSLWGKRNLKVNKLIREASIFKLIII